MFDERTATISNLEMKITESVYLPDLEGLSLAKINQRIATMPIAGIIDRLNWQEQYLYEADGSASAYFNSLYH